MGIGICDIKRYKAKIRDHELHDEYHDSFIKVLVFVFLLIKVTNIAYKSSFIKTQVA